MSTMFERQQEAWSRPPVDDVGYISSSKLMLLSDDEIIEMMASLESSRYEGCRNQNGRWRDVLGLDSTHDKEVLDYGCGTGIEALQYAKSGNRVSVADIVHGNALFARRVLQIHGFASCNLLLHEHRPRLWYGDSLERFDVVHMAGVLHHIENAEDVVAEVAGWLRPDGELRLMVYSDVSWRNATGTHPPENVRQHPAFRKYVRAMDAVGEYSDWYDCTRLTRRFGEWFKVTRCEYLDSTLGYLGAVMKAKK